MGITVPSRPAIVEAGFCLAVPFLNGTLQLAKGGESLRLSNLNQGGSVAFVCINPHTGRTGMGSTSDKASGIGNQAAGKIKQGVGRAAGNDRLEAEGGAQETKGKVQKAVGETKSAVKEAADKAASVINKKL
jgi:uncharacterized protein YjbJ (UPF0337 family)